MNDISTTRFLITGMTCGGCEQAVSRAIGSVMDVQVVQVDRSRSEAQVQWAAGVDTVRREQAGREICAAVEGAGFDCAPITPS